MSLSREDLMIRIGQLLAKRNSRLTHDSDPLYVCLGGSNIIGTADDTSDIDVRVVVNPNDTLKYGLVDFEHSKLVEGLDGVNGAFDLDVEVFSLRKFVKSLYNGEVIAVEMLHCPIEGVVLKKDLMSRLMTIKDVFITKTLVKNYCSYAYGMWRKSMHANKEAIKNPERARVLEEFDYETKYAMKSHLYFTMAKEILTGQGYNLARSDARFLLGLKNGTYTREQMNQHLETLNKECQVLLKESSLPSTPDFELVNSLCVSLVRGY